MSRECDREWWNFSLEKDHADANCHSQRSPGASGSESAVSYRSYLMLDRLLASQNPSSSVPDERAFIISHQLIELMFKLMIFDLGVISRSFLTILGLTTRQELQSYLTDKRFWSSALNATSRLRFSSGTMLPMVIQYLCSRAESEIHNFDQEQFFRFRGNLGHASGMQSAQFRLIQRALGKSELLSIRLFPRETGCCGPKSERDRCSLVTVVDESVLVKDTDIASPQPGSMLDNIARLDDLGHQVLAKYAMFDCSPLEQTITYIEQHEIERLIRIMRSMIAHPSEHSVYSGDMLGSAAKDAGDVFANDLKQAAERENIRRRSHQAARSAASYLRRNAPSTYLARVFEGLVSTDVSFHGPQNGGFLSSHLAIARDLLLVSKSMQVRGPQIAVPGTGRGSVAFLGFMVKHLVPLFPALVGFR